MGRNKNYEGSQVAVVLWIPAQTKKLTIKAKTFDGTTAEYKLKNDEIAQARSDYLTLDPYDDAFAVYRLSPLFKQFLADGGDIDDPDEFERYKREHK